MKAQRIKTHGIQQRQLRGKFIVTNISNKQPSLHLKELEREEDTEPKFNRKKGITKIRAVIKEIETEKIIEEINETKSWFFKR